MPLAPRGIVNPQAPTMFPKSTLMDAIRTEEDYQAWVVMPGYAWLQANGRSLGTRDDGEAYEIMTQDSPPELVNVKEDHALWRIPDSEPGGAAAISILMESSDRWMCYAIGIEHNVGDIFVIGLLERSEIEQIQRGIFPGSLELYGVPAPGVCEGPVRGGRQQGPHGPSRHPQGPPRGQGGGHPPRPPQGLDGYGQPPRHPQGPRGGQQGQHPPGPSHGPPRNGHGHQPSHGPPRGHAPPRSDSPDSSGSSDTDTTASDTSSSSSEDQRRRRRRRHQGLATGIAGMAALALGGEGEDDGPGGPPARGAGARDGGRRDPPGGGGGRHGPPDGRAGGGHRPHGRRH